MTAASAGVATRHGPVFDRGLAALALALAVLALLPIGRVDAGAVRLVALDGGLDWGVLPIALAGVAAMALAAMAPDRVALGGLLAASGGILIGVALLVQLRSGLRFEAASWVWLLLFAIASAIWAGMSRLARIDGLAFKLLVPLLFGGLLVYLWEAMTVGFAVPAVLLPPPSRIWATLIGSLDTAWIDFHQTFIRSVIPGYVMGCGAGFLVAVAIDRSPFLQRGLLPIGGAVSAMPIVGIAPIMVMWFGFDWHSKAAVVVVMTFFPMLVNTLAGLQSTGAMEQDLMRSYAAGYRQTLVKLRLPTALPFVFNALKLNSTLALIGAIVAEFFGTPIYGMGFRINTEVGRMNIDMVWATIAVAALAGSISYGLLALAERTTTFWHPSQRGQR